MNRCKFNKGSHDKFVAGVSLANTLNLPGTKPMEVRKKQAEEDALKVLGNTWTAAGETSGDAPTPSVSAHSNCQITVYLSFP